jgi:hypothetical protein
VQARRAILKLAIEYFLLTLPIVIYVAIEALHHGDAGYLITSPEWSIATIFILLQTYRLYSEEMKSVVGQRFGQFLVIVLVLVAIGAALNIYLGMKDVHSPSMYVLAAKWGLLIVSSVVFVYVAGAALYAAEGETS